MNNADLPAMPFIQTEGGEIVNGQMRGLTKREYFAGLALQGVLNMPIRHSKDINSAPALAINLADALLLELEKTNQKELDK